MTGAKIPWVTDLPETAALYAVCNRHYTEALRIVTDMTPVERARYTIALQALLDVINTADRIPPGASQ
jgi:hypothetical protein